MVAAKTETINRKVDKRCMHELYAGEIQKKYFHVKLTHADQSCYLLIRELYLG